MGIEILGSRNLPARPSSEKIEREIGTHIGCDGYSMEEIACYLRAALKLLASGWKVTEDELFDFAVRAGGRKSLGFRSGLKFLQITTSNPSSYYINFQGLDLYNLFFTTYN